MRPLRAPIVILAVAALAMLHPPASAAQSSDRQLLEAGAGGVSATVATLLKNGALVGARTHPPGRDARSRGDMRITATGIEYLEHWDGATALMLAAAGGHV